MDSVLIHVTLPVVLIGPVKPRPKYARTVHDVDTKNDLGRHHVEYRDIHTGIKESASVKIRIQRNSVTSTD